MRNINLILYFHAPLFNLNNKQEMLKAICVFCSSSLVSISVDLGRSNMTLK